MSGQGLVLIQNKDERAMARQILSGLPGLSMPGNLSDGFAELKKCKPGSVSLLVLDERFNQSMDARNVSLEIIDLLQWFQSSGVRALNSVVMVILNESTQTVEIPVAYSELGADVFLQRPFGIEDMRARFGDAQSWIENPPPEVKLLRVIQEHVRRGQYGEVIPTLKSLYEKNPHHVRIGSLLARALLHQGGESRSSGIELARKLDEQFPEILFTKYLLIEAYEKESKTLDAFHVGLRLFRVNSSEASFDKAMSLLEVLDPKEEKCWAEMAEVFGQLEPARTKAARSRLIEAMKAKNFSIATIRACLSKIGNGFEDLMPELKPLLAQWSKKIRAQLNERGMGEDAGSSFREVYRNLLRKILDFEVGAPEVIEDFVDLLMMEGDLKTAAKYLQKARDQKKLSVEFYSAYTKLSLEEGMLKEASDMLHAGRRLAPSDDRWDRLAKIWSQKYEAKEKQNS